MGSGSALYIAILSTISSLVQQSLDTVAPYCAAKAIVSAVVGLPITEHCESALVLCNEIIPFSEDEL